MKKVFYIDPQSRNNLAMYDYELLSRIDGEDITFWGSREYNYKEIPNVRRRLLFTYEVYENLILKALSYIKTMLHFFVCVLLARPSVIHIQWIRIIQFDYLCYRFLKFLTSTKLIYTVHNVLPHVVRSGDKERYAKMYTMCDTLIVHTEKTKQELVRDFFIPIEKIAVAPHGPLSFNEDASSVEKQMRSFSKEYTLKGKTVFSLLGFQSTYKGSDLLIEAWKQIPSSEKKDFVLIVAGKFQDVTVPEGTIQNLICIPRKLSNVEFNALLKLTSVLVFPYRRIEQSGVLLTAISEHIPYCSTSIGELTRPLKKADIGWQIDETTVECVKATLCTIMAHPEQIEQKKRNLEGWKSVYAIYDWKYSASVTKEIYEGTRDYK
jgi:glycosyltransferase involved in cell wall biosynthesis